MQSILMQPSAFMTAAAEKRSLSSNMTQNRNEPRSKRAPDVEFVCADELVVNKVLLGELLGLLIHRGRVDRYLSSAGAVSTRTKATHTRVCRPDEDTETERAQDAHRYHTNASGTDLHRFIATMLADKKLGRLRCRLLLLLTRHHFLRLDHDDLREQCCH